METLSMDYQRERPELEVSDLTALVIRALVQLAARDISDISAISDITQETHSLHFETSKVTDAAVKIAQDNELDIDPDYITSRRVGRILGKMRLRKEREAGKGTRKWALSLRDLHRWTLSYAIPIPGDDAHKLPEPLLHNVTTVTNVTNVTSPKADPLLEGVL
jgi:hypothetical protein